MSKSFPKTELELKRTLDTKQLTTYGLVMMSLLAPYQVYGSVAQESFGMVALVYMIGAFLMFFTALSYAQMSKEFPYAGSLYSYVSKGINPHVGFVTGWTILSDYILCPALVTYLAGVWMESITGVSALVWTVIFIIITTFINIRGIELNAKVNLILFWAQVASLVVFLGLAINYVFVNGLGAGGFSLQPLFQPEHIDFGFLARSVSIIALCFIGFDGISTLAEEAKNPTKSIPRATIASLMIAGLTFVLITYVAGLVHPDYTNFDNSEMALFEISKEIGGSVFFVSMVLLNVLAVGIAVTLNVQSAVSRVLMSMGRDKLLPGYKFFGKINPKFQTPMNAILFSGLVTVVVVFTLSLDTIINLISFGAITSFAILPISVFLYFFIGKKVRNFKGVILYFLCPLICFTVSAYVWSGFTKEAYIFGLSWIFLGAVVGFIKSKGYKLSGPEIKDL